MEPESADHQIISEQFDQDGHFYVVDDIDAVHGVQVLLDSIKIRIHVNLDPGSMQAK